MSGYSLSPQDRKLALLPGMRVSIDQPPPGWSLTDPPIDLVIVDEDGPADVILSFFTRAEQLPERLPALVERIYPAGCLWIAWPRRAGRHSSNITGSLVRQHALALGVIDVKVAAIDSDWSAQRVAWRPGHRRKPPAD